MSIARQSGKFTGGGHMGTVLYRPGMDPISCFHFVLVVRRICTAVDGFVLWSLSWIQGDRTGVF